MAVIRQEEDTKRCWVSVSLEPTGHLPFSGSHCLCLAISPYELWGGLSLASTTPFPLFPSLKIPVLVPLGTLKRLKKQHKTDSSTKRNQSFYNNWQKSFSLDCPGFPNFGFSTTKESFIILHPHPKRTTVYSKRNSRSTILEKQDIDKNCEITLLFVI